MIQLHRQSPGSRRGLSLIEVIACTMLVAVMALPIAGVIRASAQAIHQSEHDLTTEARMRRGLRWICNAIHHGEIRNVTPQELTLTLASGNTVRVAVANRALVMIDGPDQILIADDVSRVRFGEIKQTIPPNPSIGVTVSLTADSSLTGSPVTVDSIVSIPPQF